MKNENAEKSIFQANENTHGNVVYYNPKFKRSVKIREIYSGNAESLKHKLSKTIREGFEKLVNKNNCGEYSNSLFRCFELGCYILYGRDISDEVMEKQKAYGDEYLIDFLKYVLRMFFRRFDKDYILEKNQCTDIRLLCREFIEISDNETDNHIAFTNSLTGKEMAEIIKNCLIQGV